MSLMTITILVGMSGMALGAVAIGVRHGLHRALAYALVVVLFWLLAWMLQAPVVDDEEAAEATHVVYVGTTDRSWLRNLVNRFGDEEVVLITSPAAERDVSRWFPKARVIEVSPDEDHGGLTLQAILLDLDARVRDMPDGTNVYISGPRSDNLGRDKAVRDRIVAAHPWLNDHLFLEEAGTPDNSIDAPTAVPPDTDTFPAFGRVNNSTDADLYLEVRFIAGDGTVMTGAPDATGKVDFSTGRSRRVGSGTTQFYADLPAPEQGQTSLLYMNVRNRYGEDLSAFQVYTRCQPPEIGIIIPEATDESRSQLVGLIRSLGLAARSLVLDLDDDAALSTNARALLEWGLVALDVELTDAQGKRLHAAFEAAAKNGSPPQLLVVGTDGYDTPPSGWNRFLKELSVEFRTSRVVAIATDLSGSMSSTVPAFGKSKIQIAYDVARALDAGLRRRDGNSLIYPIGPDGEKTTLGDYTSIVPDKHTWEGGAHLLAIRRLVERGEPISDAVLFWDSADLLSNGAGSNHAILSAEQAEAAEWLIARGVRLHVISIGGDLHGANIPSVRDSVRVRFDDHSTLESLKNAIRTHVFEHVFPRLTLEAEPLGLARLADATAGAELSDAASRPRLINVLTRFRADPPNRESVLLWARHFSHDSLAPVLMTGTYKAGDTRHDVAYLGIDLVSEFAKTPSGRTEQRNALASLIVATVNALARELDRPAVIWSVDGSGRLTAMIRDHRPFNLDPNSIVAHTVDTGVGAIPDFTRLTSIAFRFTGLDTETPRDVQVVLRDIDPSIGTQTIRMPMLAMPPLPLNGEASRELFGGEPSAIFAGPATEEPAPFAIPASLMPWLFVGCCGVLCLIIARF